MLVGEIGGTSPARAESRWGLYHDRLDHPERDDTSWFHHLDLRKSPTGAMEFTARPVVPFLVPVGGFTPAGDPSRHLGEVHPEQVATAGAREAAPVALRQEPTSTGTPAHAGADADTPVTPRLLDLLALTEGEPELSALTPYLTDPEPTVRRTAVTVLTQTVPTGTGPALDAALTDTDAGVRAAAAASLRELVETLASEPALPDGLAAALSEADPVARATTLDVLRALRLGDVELFADLLSDSDIAVRIAAVRALVSIDAAAELARAAAVDPSREVRVTITKALATAGQCSAVAHSALAELVDDPDALVRGAAHEALGTAGCPAALAARAEAALADPAWQVRAGAATALSATDPDVAVPALAKALADANADVRKAAVLALTRHHRATEDARAALAAASTDSAADVRTYASRAL